jgi:hypothetical protein
VLVFVCCLGLASGTEVPDQRQLLDPGGFALAGEATVETVEGEPVLYLRSGRTLRRDVRFTDGTIEFEMRPTDRRAFFGVVFRAASGDHMEDIYFRLHKSQLPDAIQYSPDYGGRGQWQLYHGPTATAAARYSPGVWQRVRIEVKGGQAAVFVGDAREPQLVVDRLRSGSATGTVGFWGNQPGATGDDPASALVRRVTIRHGETSHAFSEPEPERWTPGVVQRWGVSAAFVRKGEVFDDPPSQALGGPWQDVPAEFSGLLSLDRHVRPAERGAATVLVGLRIHADGARVARFDLGFSDDVVAFLNGRAIYAGRNGFSTNFPRRQGLITLDQASLPLRLEAGDNRLVFAVSEVTGGWGVMGRIEDRTGLVVEPLRK